MNERVQIFTEGDRRDRWGNFRWGWQCFVCGAEHTGYGNASTARDGADNHEAICPVALRQP